MKKTIIHISKYYYPTEGGIEAVAKYLTEGLNEFQNIMICFCTTGKDKHDNINGIDIYRIKSTFKISSQDIAISFFYKARKIINQYQPDALLIHCPNPFVYPIAGLINNKCKIVLLWHSDIIAKGILYSLIKPIENMILKKASMIISTSPNYIHPNSPIFKYKEKTEVVPNGIVQSTFELQSGEENKIEDIRKKYGYRKIILFVGRHVQYKGIDKLIATEKLIKSDCKILIAGRGPMTEKLKQLSTSPRIEFLGKITYKELRLYYHAASIFAFPSNTRQEAFGIALAEAMYCGCVPVTFKIEGSGVNWLSINDETGKTVELNNVRDFAKAIDGLLANEKLTEKLSIASKLRISKFFTDTKSVEKTNCIFKKLLR